MYLLRLVRLCPYSVPITYILLAINNLRVLTHQTVITNQNVMFIYIAHYHRLLCVAKYVARHNALLYGHKHQLTW